MGVEWLNRYVALEKEEDYGVEPGTILTITVTAGSNYAVTTGTWVLGTKAATVRGGFGAKGTYATTGGALSMVLTEGGQGYTDLDNFAFTDITFTAALGSGSGAGVTLTYDDSKGVTYGEVDDESMKQTFELLTRSDMSRQVASKAVTNTQYGEGSINLAVQPDDFMGKILHSFLPATETGAGFIESVSVTNRGGIYNAAGTYKIPVAANSSTSVEPCEIVAKIELISTGVAPAAQVAANSSAAFALATTGSVNQLLILRALTGVEKHHNQLEGVAVTNRALMNDNDFLYFYDANGVLQFAGAINGAMGSATTLDLDGSNDGNSKNRTLIPANSLLYSYRLTDVYIINPGKTYATSNVPTVSFAAVGGLSSAGNAEATLVKGASRHHIFNEPVLSTHSYPSYTMRVGRGEKEHTFTGMVASKLSFSANLNEYVMASVDFVGKNEGVPTTLVADVDYAGLAVDALHFADAEVYFEDNPDKTIKVQQITFEININRDIDSAYAVGNRSFTRAPPTTMREVTGTMEFNEVLYSTTAGYINEPTYTQLTGTSVHKIQPGAGKEAIRILFGSEGKDANDNPTDFLEFKFFNVRFEAPTASVSGRDPNRMSVGFQAFYDASALGSAKSIEAKLVGSGAHIQTTAYDA